MAEATPPYSLSEHMYSPAPVLLSCFSLLLPAHTLEPPTALPPTGISIEPWLTVVGGVTSGSQRKLEHLELGSRDTWF